MESRDEKRIKRLKGLRRAVKGEAQTAAATAGKTTPAQPLAFLRPYRPVFLALAIFILGGMIARKIGLGDNGYTLTDHLSEVAITVTDPEGKAESMDLSGLAWYILRMEREVDGQARIYNAEDPTAYWKLRISNYEEASYIAEISKKTVLEAAQRDLIYASEARRAGARLDEEAKKSAFLEAERDWLSMTEQEKKATGLTVEKLSEVKERELLARKYMEYLGEEGKSGLEPGGAYYEALCLSYEVTLNREATDPIRMGYVTIN